jgi:hypothetical protein
MSCKTDFQLYKESIMSLQTLTSVAKNVVGQYDHAGKQLVGAWRAGTTRAVDAVNRRFAQVVESRALPLATDDVKKSLIDAQAKIAGLVSFGLGLPARGTDVALDRVSRGVTRGIDRVSETAIRVESAFSTTALDSASKLALPAAYVSLQVASFVDRSTGQLCERVGAVLEPAAVAPVKRAAASRSRRPSRKA